MKVSTAILQPPRAIGSSPACPSRGWPSSPGTGDWVASWAGSPAKGDDGQLAVRDDRLGPPSAHLSGRTCMTHLVVLGVDNRDDAERLFDLAGDLAKQELLQLQDAAYAYKDDKGKVRIHQAISLTGAGAASGALWGTLIGMLFLMPIAGLAIGAGTGALAGKLSDVDINDDTIKQIGEQLQQGKAALFVLARSATTDR